MSGWLCSTKKFLSRAMTSLAEELENTANDLNEAIMSMGVSGEEDQVLYGGPISVVSSDVARPPTTTQQPQKSALLPAQVVPGDIVVEQHFSKPPTPGSDGQEGAKTAGERAEPAQLSKHLSASHGLGTQEMPIGVISEQHFSKPTSSSHELYHRAATDGEMKGTDQGDNPQHQHSPKANVICRTTGCEEDLCSPSQPNVTGSPDRDSNSSPQENVMCRTVDCEEDYQGTPRCSSSKLKRRDWQVTEKRPGKIVRTPSKDTCVSDSNDHSDSRLLNSEDNVTNNQQTSRDETSGLSQEQPRVSPWLGQFSNVLTFAYSKVSGAVNNFISELEEENRSNVHLQLSPETNSGVSAPIGKENTATDSSRHVDVMTSSTYSTESFEIIEPSMFTNCEDLISTSPQASPSHPRKWESTTKPVFIVGDSPEMSTNSALPTTPVSTPDVMSTSSAELIDFNFRDLISGHSTPVSYRTQIAGKKTLVPGGSTQYSRSTSSVVSDDDDGSSSFDILSDPGDEV